MRSRSRFGATTAVVAGGAALLALTAGLPGGTTGVVGTVPPAAAGALPTFDSCQQLRQWYVDATLPLVGPWGIGVPYPYPQLRSPVNGAAAAQEIGPAGNGPTGTNVQEAGVDEPDVAKTDGRTLVSVTPRGTLVVTDVTGPSPVELSRLRLPGGARAAELLLAGDTVVVLGSPPGFDEHVLRGGPISFGGPVVGDVARPFGPSVTHMVTVDISDRLAPVVRQDERVDGTLVSARQYGGTVRVVLTSGVPRLRFVYPARGRSRAEARRENRRIVRDAPIGAWLPTSRVVTGGGRSSDGPLLDCTDVRHPEHGSGLGTISVLTFAADSPSHRTATAVTAAGDLVYSSADRLYVATTVGGWYPVRVPGFRVAPRRGFTQVHAFALDGLATRYVASGRVPGWVRDRWSFSEYDGRLRVATALGRDSWRPRENAVVVLEEHGDRLMPVGRVTGIGRHEQIQSVRWFGDVAVMVTFRQTDPLFTLDLSDARDPRLLGEVRLPGFSSYLHPVGGDLLLGLGQAATPRGTVIGAQAATFDLKDLSRPHRIDAFSLPGHASFVAATDPRAFTYLPGRRVALATLEDYSRGGTRLLALAVGPRGALTETSGFRLGRWDAYRSRALPVDGGRVAMVSGARVRLLSLV